MKAAEVRELAEWHRQHAELQGGLGLILKRGTRERSVCLDVGERHARWAEKLETWAAELEANKQP